MIMATPDDIITHARACLGTPFVHQGRIQGVAMDCAGLIVHVARKLGFEPVEPRAYGRIPHSGMLELHADSQPYLIMVEDMRPGDILMMRFRRDPQHVSIYTGENIIHSYQAIGRVCEHRLSSLWESRIVRVYRFKGVR